MRSALGLALNRIGANRLRSALTILGIVIGIMSVVALVSLGNAVQQAIEEEFGGLGAGSLTVLEGGGYGFTSDDLEQANGEGVSVSMDMTGDTRDPEPLTDAETSALHDHADVAAVAPTVTAYGEVSHDRETIDGQVLATTPSLADIEAMEFTAGSFFDDFMGAQRLPVVVLGNSAAGELRIDPAQAVGTEITVDRQRYTVMGVLDESGQNSTVPLDQSVIMPLETAKGSLVDRDPDYDSIRIMLTDAADNSTTQQIQQTLRTVRELPDGTEDDFSIVEATAIMDAMETTTSMLTAFVGVLGGISLLVGAIGVANMMLVSVRERTREIGVRRAVGATRSAITIQFLVEAIVLTIMGGIVGTILGALLANLLAGALMDIPAFVSLPAIVLALTVSALVGIAAGLGPAWKAASVDPTEALRYE